MGSNASSFRSNRSFLQRLSDPMQISLEKMQMKMKYVRDDPLSKDFSVNRHIFTDQDLFKLEMNHIFGASWNFLGFETDVSSKHDFFSTWIGDKSVFVTRDSSGDLHAFYNRCPHKGATICQDIQGNARAFVCPYHAWTFSSAGNLVGIKEQAAGAYAESFASLNHDLEPIARISSYRGLIFGSLTNELPPLEEFLGEMKFFIDLVMDQGPHGMEPIPGRSVFTYRANWKMQLENGLDSYHLTSTHSSFVSILEKRRHGEGNQSANALDWAKSNLQAASAFSFEHGHCALVMDYDAADRRPFIDMEEIRERLSSERSNWSDLTFNSLIFPNLQIVQNTALAIRHIRPISHNLTELHYYCLGAKGESKTKRSLRLRAFEDFYNASGLATPDDATVYELCQLGLLAGVGEWSQGYARGAELVVDGGNRRSAELGIFPKQSATGSMRTGFETLLHAPYRQWNYMMKEPLSRTEDSYAE